MSKHRADVEPDVVPTEIAPPPSIEAVPSDVPDVDPGLPSAIRVQDGLINVADLDGYLQERFGHFLSDIERRVGQARELEASVAAGGGRRMIHAEDIDDLVHRIEGYTVTANSPGAGSIAWASVHIMYAGVDYTIADGNTSNRYVWFVKPGSYTPGTPVTLQNSNTKPTLATGDAFVFVNNGGTPVSALDAGGTASVLGPNSVDTAAIIAGAVGTTQIANNAVGATQIANNAVGSTQLANGAVGATQLANGAVSPVKLNILDHVMF